MFKSWVQKRGAGMTKAGLSEKEVSAKSCTFRRSAASRASVRRSARCRAALARRAHPPPSPAPLPPEAVCGGTRACAQIFNEVNHLHGAHKAIALLTA